MTGSGCSSCQRKLASRRGGGEACCRRGAPQTKRGEQTRAHAPLLRCHSTLLLVFRRRFTPAGAAPGRVWPGGMMAAVDEGKLGHDLAYSTP